ncbi:hypothetical protein [Bacillus cereus]|nr:hypothetical protein [Bacillus cereus]
MYSPKINEFIRTYVKAIEGSNAAVFAGAGLSQPAGHVNLMVEGKSIKY